MANTKKTNGKKNNAPAEVPDKTVVAQGCDYAFAPYPSAAQLKAAGKSFVCRYLSGGSSKDVTLHELEDLIDGGIAVVLNWETSGQMPDEAQGVSDAIRATAEAGALGHGSAPIIFSADFDPNGDTAGIVAYMTGVASVLGKSRTGIYGGNEALDAVADICTYFWQTSAWSGGVVSSHAQLYQYAYNGDVAGIGVDLDEAFTANFGQIGSSVTPPPPPPPPPPAGWPLVKEGDDDGAVRTVQYLLNQAGASLTVDGNFGPLTLAAVEAFQGAHSITETGQVHDYTWPRLVVTVQNGSTGDAVRAVQAYLTGVVIDGNDGPATTAAVKAFQSAHKLSADGIVGPLTWEALVSLSAPTPPAPTPVVNGTMAENALTLAKFLLAHGYSKNGAGGIITCVYGESALNPESVGDGGCGLIGWTPCQPGLVTGNADRDLETQMTAILTYNNENDAVHIATLNAQPSITAAADYYSQVFERPLVLDSDVHAEGVALATTAVNAA